MAPNVLAVDYDKKSVWKTTGKGKSFTVKVARYLM